MQKVGKKDDFVMTLNSDDEIERNSDDSSSDDEEKAEKIQKKQAVLTKKQKLREMKKLKQKNKNKKMAEDFHFDANAFVESSSSTGSSWDFSRAISRISEMEKASGKFRGTGKKIADKICEIRKERQEEKKAKKTEKEDADIDAKDKTKVVEEEEDPIDSTISKEGNNDDDEDDNEGSDEEEEEDEDTIIEEQKLQDAIVAKAQNDSTNEEDEIERRKAEAFFENDPFGVNDLPDVNSFQDLHLCRPLMKAITHLGFTKPTPIQQRCIPVALSGKDICASAQTGSGKTAAFILPVLERLHYMNKKGSKNATTRVLIICPVRELATQVQAMLEKLSQFSPTIDSCLVIGGLPLKVQEKELRLRPDIVICTPGRLIDHLRNSLGFHLDDLEILILDEADRLLELGFMDEIKEIISLCPKARQTMLFSATLTSKVDQLIELSMKRPVRVKVDNLFNMAKALVQEFVRIRPQRETDREAILLALCTRTFKTNTIVFMETKKEAHRMMIVFGLSGIKAAELHGDLSQVQRLEALDKFRNNQADILICTDIAARGIDISGVHAVINYEMPKDLTTYVHRVGRTARAGRKGRAVTLTSEHRRLIMKQVVRHCHGMVKSRAIPPEVIDQWSLRIENMEKDVKQIYREELLEKRMYEAEKETTRVKNLVIHKDEIMSRPKRTWFQTEKEKKDVQANALEENNKIAEQELKKSQKKQLNGNDTENDKDKNRRLNRQKKRNLAIREAEMRSLTENSSTFTESSVVGAAKSAKKKAVLEKRQRENLSLSEIAANKRAKINQNFEKKARSGKFDVDLSGASKQVKPKAEKTYTAKEFQFKEKITEFKKGGKKGAHSFKSKTRFKRRG